MFLNLQGVLPGYSRGLHKRSLQRPRPNLYVAGEKKLKWFEHLAPENETSGVGEVDDYEIPLVIPYSE